MISPMSHDHDHDYDLEREQERERSGEAGWLGAYSEQELPFVTSHVVQPGGVVHLVGAGPGDPGLLTVRGRALLDAADAIVHDALVDPALLERRDPTRPPPELYDVGKRGGEARSARQEDINALLVRLAREGKRVVRLKGGDPFVFGRGGEEAQALAEAGVPFDIVPGVTAGIAAAAYAGIPVTHRGLSTSVTFVTGHEDPEKGTSQTDWSALARTGGTLVLYMGVKRLPEIVRRLVEHGMQEDMPAAAIEWGTFGRQRTVVATVGTLPDEMRRAGLAAPVVTVIGWPVVLRDEIAWFDRRPLFGRRIVVTRPMESSALAERLRAHGAEVLAVPATRIEPIESPLADDAFDRLDEFDWLVFTSRNAVRYFWERLRRRGLDARALAHVKIAVIGSGTGEALLRCGLAADVVPERFVAEGLLEALREREDLVGARVLYLSAEGSRQVLPEGMETLGAAVEVVPLYRSVPHEAEAAEPLRTALAKDEVDLVTFTSASTVHGFVATVGEELARRVPAVSIGEVTSAAARDAGITVAREAAEATLDALVEAVISATEELPPRAPARDERGVE